ncbi:MAG: methyltransferase domain-containing protein [Planctomycetales bacterium]|nr:methyltransferase domain-containing protein [Planctomycetales bacterium]
MNDVERHYHAHLAPIYVWMSGGLEAAFLRGEAELTELGLLEGRGRSVLDLGAGFGMHAIPLARRGYCVTAVDSSELLLGTLRQYAADVPVATNHGDLVEYVEDLASNLDLILCMGDTLPHLQDDAQVQRLILGAHRALRPRGRLVLSFRDYTQAREGVARFLPVRSDEARILTCFLEYSTSHVTVHDLLQEKQGNAWTTTVSAYRKLRLTPDSVVAALVAQGFNARCEKGVAGMVRIDAVRD